MERLWTRYIVYIACIMVLMSVKARTKTEGGYPFSLPIFPDSVWLSWDTIHASFRRKLITVNHHDRS
jgi:hypothetical protein